MTANAFGFLKNIHFVGIGGIGMSGIAEVLHNMGFGVTGSDIADNANVERLRSLGVKIYVGHRAENIKGADVIVYSSAVKDDNSELVKAKEEYLPVISRGEMLAELMRMKFAVGVSGSHGKTTTTSMISEVLSAAGYDPTSIIGGRLNSISSNAQLGKSAFMVAEADESDRSFLMLFPSIAVVTNIDYEHMESYTDLADVKESFAKYVNRVPFYGCAVVCLDDAKVSDIIPLIEKRFITYGIKAQADIRAVNIVKDGFSVSYDVEAKGNMLGRVSVKLPGDHIVLNSLAAVAVGLEMQAPFDVISSALAKFGGVQRRMTVRYKSDSAIVIDDYGHHPTEIVATLKAVREAVQNYKVCVIFQPHRYSRTQSLMQEFAKCFFDADYLLVTDIYPASEKSIPGVTPEALVAEIKKRGFKNVRHVKSENEIFNALSEIGYKDMLVLTMGAGSITKLSYEIADRLSKGMVG